MPVLSKASENPDSGCNFHMGNFQPGITRGSFMRHAKFVILPFVLAVLFSASPLSGEQPSGENETIRVLFVYGGHEFDEKEMYEMLDSFKDVVYDKAEMPKALDLFQPGLEKKYDCIVMYDSYKFPYTHEQTEKFKRLLEKGIALVVLHHSTWGFNGWADFANITGAQCFFRDGYEVNGVKCVTSTWDHDQTVDVKIADKNHPITKGIADFTLIDETYAKAYIHPDVHVLWTTDHPKSDRVIAWTWKYANSPVFTTMQGHDARVYTNPSYSRSIHQAIQWTVDQLRQAKK